MTLRFKMQLPIWAICCLVAGFGAAYGTAKSGVGIASMGVMRPELVMKSIVPVVMAGVLGIYGLIIAVIISTGSEHLLLDVQVLVWIFNADQHICKLALVDMK